MRVSEIARISASPARNSGDPNAGGGGGRNWSPEVRKNGRVPYERAHRRGGRVHATGPVARTDRRRGRNQHVEIVGRGIRHHGGADRTSDLLAPLEVSALPPASMQVGRELGVEGGLEECGVGREETGQDDDRCPGRRGGWRGATVAMLGTFRGDDGVVLCQREIGEDTRLEVDRSDKAARNELPGSPVPGHARADSPGTCSADNCPSSTIWSVAIGSVLVSAHAVASSTTPAANGSDVMRCLMRPPGNVNPRMTVAAGEVGSAARSGLLSRHRMVRRAHLALRADSPGLIFRLRTLGGAS